MLRRHWEPSLVAHVAIGAVWMDGWELYLLGADRLSLGLSVMDGWEKVLASKQGVVGGITS